jgi:hypothetical protein
MERTKYKYIPCFLLSCFLHDSNLNSIDKKMCVKMRDRISNGCGRDLSANKLCMYVCFLHVILA